jgi:hypothetical protein
MIENGEYANGQLVLQHFKVTAQWHPFPPKRFFNFIPHCFAPPDSPLFCSLSGVNICLKIDVLSKQRPNTGIPGYLCPSILKSQQLQNAHKHISAVTTVVYCCLLLLMYGGGGGGGGQCTHSFSIACLQVSSCCHTGNYYCQHGYRDSKCIPY